MKTIVKACLALAVLAWSQVLCDAQTPAPAASRVVVDDLHCEGCAKKVAARLGAVAGVAEVRVNLQAKSLWALHKAGSTPSPKALWEAVEAADYKPTRLEAPAGTFTSKPRS